ncbi:MAG: FHA domain-containing protein, partial [Chloroflexota bacterium]
MANDNTEKSNPQNDDGSATQNISTQANLLQMMAEEGNVNTHELLIVSFYLPGRSEPIIINGSKKITIGRRDPKRRINPTIDLTEDHGAKLGVSRMHAELNFIGNRYFVKDTGSSNGTWINDNKLEPYQAHPVTTGDQVRIGQLAIVVHLSVPQRIEGDVISTRIDSEIGNLNSHSYRVKDATGGILVENGAIAISKLRSLGTYLERLSRIYDIIRDAQDQDSSTVFSVKAIKVRSDEILVIDVGEGKDIMDFMATKLPEFLVVLDGKVEGTKKQTDSLER